MWWPHHGFSPCLVIAPQSPFLCQVLSLSQYLAQALARSKLVLNCHVVPKEVGVLLWADMAGLVPMATDVTTLPGLALPLSPGQLRWDLAVVLKSSGQLPTPRPQPWVPVRLFLSLALLPRASLSLIIPSAVSFLRARYSQVLVIVP